MTTRSGLVISRRGLLLAGAGGLLVAACGRGGPSDAAGTATTTTTAGRLTLAPVFSPQQPAGVEIRLPLALADTEGVLVDDVPDRLSVRTGLVPDGALGEPVMLERHDRGIPRAYFPLVTTFAAPGNWRIAAEADGRPAEMVVAAMDRSQVPAVPVVGQPLISLPTPTVDDARGVEPICTATPPCPLHVTSLDAAIGGAADGNKAIALLIATPGLCQTAICGPVLDLLVARQAEFAETVTMIHAEVYTDDTARDTTETVNAYGLAWEPSLFLALPDGTITNRLDYTYDERELDQALAELVQ
ncbi:MAG: hypothetical protein ACR2G7_00650 [Acidimicrobiales bacterium]